VIEVRGILDLPKKPALYGVSGMRALFRVEANQRYIW
jgi:hypothetical protein